MDRTTRQQLTPEHPRSSDDPALVEEVFDAATADEMRQLTGIGEQGEQRGVDGGLNLSRAESATITEAEESLVEERRSEYILWAEGIKMDKEWIDDNFIFNTDGTVVCETDIPMTLRKNTTLPPGLIEVKGNLLLGSCNYENLVNLPRVVRGNLNLSQNPLTSLRGLPEEIHGNLIITDSNISSLEGLSSTIVGDLVLAYNPIVSLEELPKSIGGDLNIRGVITESIPKGIGIGGVVNVDSEQTALAEDCVDKGYDVQNL